MPSGTPHKCPACAGLVECGYRIYVFEGDTPPLCRHNAVRKGENGKPCHDKPVRLVPSR